MVGREPSEEEKFKIIIMFLKDHNGSAGYKVIQSHCENQFEGVRLILKKMKEQGLIEYDGMMPMFDSIIKLKKIT
jgi:hypothetical protein